MFGNNVRFGKRDKEKRDLILRFTKYDKKEDLGDKEFLDTLNKIKTGQIDSFYFAKKNVSAFRQSK